MIQDWYPKHPPLYDISKSYLENLTQGPFFTGEIPQRPKSSQKFSLFGHDLASPLGVPAGPLLGSHWIALAARLGFDVLTYKTIRSFEHDGHPLPNMIYVEPTGPHSARELAHLPKHLDELTVTNSFGMPSRSPDFLMQDIEKANRAMGSGQLLIVSVVGTPNRGVSFQQDFVNTALLAKEAGAKVIEANFSCPNVDRAEGMLYTSPETVREYASALVKAIHPLPLILKIGEIENPLLLQQVLEAAALANVSGICGLNSVSMSVTGKHNQASLGPKREKSGVCGSAIRERALTFIRQAHTIIQREKFGLTLLGCGGIVQAEHFDLFLEAGAQLALTATGMMWDPLLAMRYHAR